MAKKDVSNEDLALMIKDGFDGVDKRFNQVEKRLDDLEQGQEDIKLRLTNVAYRFELVEMERKFESRLKRLEKKIGIK
jgi:archaellum component FlaC